MSLEEERYTFKQVAKKTKVSLSTVWRWHLAGTKGKKLESVLIGGRRFVLKSQLDAFCGERRQSSPSRLRQDLAKRKLDARIGVVEPSPSKPEEKPELQE
jgi:transposase